MAAADLNSLLQGARACRAEREGSAQASASNNMPTMPLASAGPAHNNAPPAATRASP
jgi:hypothetical protein